MRIDTSWMGYKIGAVWVGCSVADINAVDHHTSFGTEVAVIAVLHVLLTTVTTQ